MCTTISAKAQAAPISGSLPVICGVYCITHIPTGKRYIGQSIDCLRRMLEHQGLNTLIGHAVRRHGRQQFHYDILSEVPREQLLSCEAGWIAMLNTEFPHGFNNTFGRKHRMLRRRAMHGHKTRRKTENVFG